MANNTAALPTLALSVQQPWAWLIVNGLKDIENRTWPTRVRGDVLIHAGKRFDREGYRFVQRMIAEGESLDLPAPEQFERGGIVGMTRITGCVEDHNSIWFFGPYGFTLDRRASRPLPFRPVRGALGFFAPATA
jgi:hypothetical protein